MKNLKTGSVSIILIVTGIILLGGVVVYFTQQQIKTNSIRVVEAPLPVSTTTPLKTPDSITQGPELPPKPTEVKTKIYSGYLGLFTVEYPSYWTISPNNTSAFLLKTNKTQSSGDDNSVEVGIDDQERIISSKSHGGPVSKEEISINGYMGYKVVFKDGAIRYAITIGTYNKGILSIGIRVLTTTPSPDWLKEVDDIVKSLKIDKSKIDSIINEANKSL